MRNQRYNGRSELSQLQAELQRAKDMLFIKQEELDELNIQKYSLEIEYRNKEKESLNFTLEVSTKILKSIQKQGKCAIDLRNLEAQNPNYQSDPILSISSNHIREMSSVARAETEELEKRKVETQQEQKVILDEVKQRIENKDEEIQSKNREITHVKERIAGLREEIGVIRACQNRNQSR